METPTIPDWIREFKHDGYTNVFSVLPNCKSLYGTETLYGDWAAPVLLLLKDGLPTDKLEARIARGEINPWRHAQKELGDDGGQRTNNRLAKLADRIDTPKLYGSATANMLCDIPGMSRKLPGFDNGELHIYLVRVLQWVVSSMPNLRVIACCGKEAWYLSCHAMNLSDKAKSWQEYRDNNEGRHLVGQVQRKTIKATAHYHTARNSDIQIAQNWDLLANLLS